MNRRPSLKRSLAPLVVGLVAALLVPAQAFGKALVRFIHAVPGVGRATVQVNGVDLGSLRFGQVSPWRTITSGSFSWTLTGGGKKLVSGTSTVGSGAYDIVVLDKPSGVALGVYKAEGGKPGVSLVRVIHAAPELGSPQLDLDHRTAVNSLAFTQATPYLSVTPGLHSLAAMKPGDSTPLVAASNVRFLPGVAYSAIVIGSRGQAVRVLDLVDRAGFAGAHGAVEHRSGPATSGTTGRTVIVRSGDSLWSIAASTLPSGASDSQIDDRLVQIWNRNEARIGTGRPSLIYPGTRLVV